MEVDRLAHVGRRDERRVGQVARRRVEKATVVRDVNFGGRYVWKERGVAGVNLDTEETQS